MTTAATPKLSLRSRIEVRISTDPALVGYHRTAEERQAALESFRASSPQFVGTVAQAKAYAMRQAGYIGRDTFKRIEYTRVATGELVDRWELDQLVAEREQRSEARADKRRGLR